MQKLVVFLFSLFLLVSCKKLDWPWHNPNPSENYKLDSNSIVATVSGIVDGSHQDGTTFSTEFGIRLNKDGFVNSSVHNLSTYGGSSILYYWSNIHDYLMPLKSKTGKNIVVTGGVSYNTYSNRNLDIVPLDEYRKYYHALRDSGWTVYIITNPYQNPAFNDKGIGHGGYVTGSGYDSTEFIARIAALNDSVRNGYQSFADGYIDVAANPRFSQFDSVYYQLDHWHFTEAGLRAVSDIIYEGLKPELSR